MSSSAWTRRKVRAAACVRRARGLTGPQDGVELTDARNGNKVFYQTLNRAHGRDEAGAHAQRDPEAEPAREIVDVILSGKTDDELQPAWGSFTFTGRVRLADGLVVLVREQLSPQGKLLGRTLYAGYVVSSQNLVGRWKYCTPGAQWEGIWSLCKAAE
ncbi:hypothetical protein BC834DRAFT_374134 [Gloeopeniophorella convolvens]|nr:hypothetical protein BC834DRAFT_374134 [Gloeopeniophorella convolvens]